MASINTENANQGVFDFLENKSEGAYARLIAYALDIGASIIQTPEYFIVMKGNGDVLHCIFAYGSMKGIIRFGRAFCREFGYKKVSWSREFVGKHVKTHIYNLESFVKHG